MARASNSFSANVVSNNGSSAVVLLGELDMDTTPILANVLEPFINEGPEEISLDLSGLSFIDSSGIATLISVQKQLVERGRRLSLHSPRPLVVKVLEVTDLIDFLNVESNQTVE